MIYECSCGGHNFTRIISLKKEDEDILIEEKFLRCTKCGRENSAQEVNKFFGVK